MKLILKLQMRGVCGGGRGVSDVVFCNGQQEAERILGLHKGKGRYEIGLLVISNWSEYQSFIFPSWLVFI
jgi:hypothetical protein